MKAMYKISLVILAVLLLLTGCSSVYDDLRGTSEPSASELTPEGMDEISRELESSSAAAAASKQNAKTTTAPASAAPADTDTSASASQTAAVTPSDTLEPDVFVTAPASDIVYWTKGGSVWHISRSCSALKNSTDILSGSEDEALAAGKSRACKKCG